MRIDFNHWMRRPTVSSAGSSVSGAGSSISGASATPEPRVDCPHYLRSLFEGAPAETLKVAKSVIEAILKERP